jgi:hypothetical protein
MGPRRIDQPQSRQVVTGSPSMPRTAAPQRFAPQGPVPMPDAGPFADHFEGRGTCLNRLDDDTLPDLVA